MSRLRLPPLSIYVHIPWCLRKCPYCDFNSHAAPDVLPIERYIDCLLSDLELDATHVAGREVQSVFFGGGTPSLFPPDSIHRFLAAARRTLPFAEQVEITLEANPGAIEHGRFLGYVEAGVTRVSLGVQSFNDHQLKVLGRIHGSTEVVTAVTELRAAGIANFNLDLMYGLPGQTHEEALQDLERAIALEPPHLSHYQLTLEPGTAFYHRPPRLPDEDTAWEMQIRCQDKLAAAGYFQYEVSAYALAGFECRHNLNYWRFGDYLGLGAGAHGKWTDIDAGRLFRSERQKQPREYMSKTAPEPQLRVSSIPPESLPFEFMLNVLRLREGFSTELFESRTGLDIATLEPALTTAHGRGLLEQVGRDQWSATTLGRQFLNDLHMLFLDVPRSSSARPERRGASV
jgi:putative oxygen-independent coproporphyrinogen III oxidase